MSPTSRMTAMPPSSTLKAMSAALLAMAAGAAGAGPIPQNLGTGLADLATRQHILANPRSPLARQAAATKGSGIAVADTTAYVVRDGASRVLVNIVVNGRYSCDQVRAAVSAVPGMASPQKTARW